MGVPEGAMARQSVNSNHHACAHNSSDAHADASDTTVRTGVACAAVIADHVAKASTAGASSGAERNDSDTHRWLAECQTSPDGYFYPIGCNGFYAKGEIRAEFDQQPLEAYAMVSASLEAWRITRDDFWRKEAQRAFEWFLGRNHLNQPLYDSVTGGCRDAIHQDRINDNQGAESTLAFHLALAEMRLAQHIIDPQIRKN
ncbi:MAG: hypothetical protein EOP21_01885 [Hyphomicrobiales bacterium]|nr:MAG: hypothetical protein EOP21_01885 [Hyphomicrobiales bacterium]